MFRSHFFVTHFFLSIKFIRGIIHTHNICAHHVRICFIRLRLRYNYTTYVHLSMNVNITVFILQFPYMFSLSNDVIFRNTSEGACVERKYVHLLGISFRFRSFYATSLSSMLQRISNVFYLFYICIQEKFNNNMISITYFDIVNGPLIHLLQMNGLGWRLRLVCVCAIWMSPEKLWIFAYKLFKLFKQVLSLSTGGAVGRFCCFLLINDQGKQTRREDRKKEVVKRSGNLFVKVRGSATLTVHCIFWEKSTYMYRFVMCRRCLELQSL